MAGFGTAPFGISPFGLVATDVGPRNLTIRVGRPRTRAVTVKVRPWN